jgi:lysophospholipase L1-like esterase
MAKWAKIITINLLIVSIILLLIEIIIRIVFPQITPLGVSDKLFQKNKYGVSFGFTPNVIETAFGVNIITNSDGFIVDRTLPHNNSVNKAPRIIFMGDSITAGVGVEAKDSFSFIIQRRLTNYNIVNASVIGYGIEDYYNVLDALIKKGYNFEGAIICICLNDISFFSKLNINKSLEQKNEDYRNIMFQNFLVRFLTKISDRYIDFNAVLREYSRTYLLMKSILVDSGKGYFLADLEPYNKPEANNYIENELKKINNILVNNGKLVMFCLFPYEFQLRRGSQDTNNIDILKPQRMIIENAEKHKIDLIDLSRIFAKTIIKEHINSKQFYLFNDPMHFSKTGHQVIAQAIWKEMLNKKLVKESFP